ncbi:MAG: DUF5700 domain-containing putative Zn-dependent protease [Candidatus Aenigmatarchaeota archaeon]
MLPEIYNRIYNNKRKERLELYLSPEIEDHYSKILNDIETGRKDAINTLSEFLNFSLDIPYPKMIIVEKLPIIKYKGNFYPILGEEDGKAIKINKAFYTSDCFPIILDFDDGLLYTLPLCYRLKEEYVYETISHEFLHHALRDRIINEAVVHKLSKSR